MLIGITGKKNSGKDTVAKIIILILYDYSDEGVERFLYDDDLIDIVPSDVKIRSFAEPIKRMVAELINEDVEALEDREFKEKELPAIFTSYGDRLTPRKLMQLIGTEFGREMIHNDIWVDLLFENYDSTKKWIISDVRFENEAIRILKAGGYLLQVVSKEVGIKDTHASETSDLYNLCYRIITNDKEKGFKPLIKEVRNFLNVAGIYGN